MGLFNWKIYTTLIVGTKYKMSINGETPRARCIMAMKRGQEKEHETLPSIKT